jgi:hypothetical protein
MPYFPAVGHIDDNLSPEEVTKEYRRRYSLAAYHKKRELIVDELGRKCETCGATNDLVFVKKPGAPDFKVGQLANVAESVRVTLLEHVYLLCEEHAKQKLYKKGRVTHGTYWSSYKIKCPCEECEEYRANRSLERREERRAKKASQPPKPVVSKPSKPRVPKPVVPKVELPKPRKFIPVAKPIEVAEEPVVVQEAPVKYDLTDYQPYNEEDNQFSVPDTRRW